MGSQGCIPEHGKRGVTLGHLWALFLAAETVQGTFGTLDLVIHSANLVAILGGIWALIKIAVPTGLSIRDSMRDTVRELTALQRTIADHEARLRAIEYDGPERREPRKHRWEDGQ